MLLRIEPGLSYVSEEFAAGDPESTTQSLAGKLNEGQGVR
jgi:hypothetical protein